MMQPFYAISPKVKQKKQSIKPIFIPFAGCTTRCIFCAQEVQSGQKILSNEDIFGSINKYLSAYLLNENLSYNSEIAFFGGTFTCLPKNLQEKYLGLVTSYKQQGIKRYTFYPPRCRKL